MSTSKTIKVTAHAKVNLTLHVVGQRANGYHELHSLVCLTEF
ncbi:MAG: 4-(cytidine 5'-diphospho)-2-C-methyl-D-erythritol kinase, partial [Paracoccaceae bacterium]